MRAKLSQPRIRDIALFVAVAGLVAAVIVFVVRDLGLSEQAAAVPDRGGTTSTEAAPTEASGGQRSEAEPAPASTDLTLAISAPGTCEVEPYTHAMPGRVPSLQDDGSTRWIWKNLGYGGVAEFELQWSVGGGTGPLRLVIDGESRDATREYRGQAGSASLGCLVNPGETLIHTPAPGWGDPPVRLYRQRPSIDSGPKTIRATVTDETGATAKAQTEVYVILIAEGDLRRLPDGSKGPFKYRAGQTYRINGVLMTFPADAQSGSSTWVEGGENSFSILFHRGGYRGWIAIAETSGRELSRGIEEFPRPGTVGTAEAPTDREAALRAYLDALMESVGKPPIDGGGP